MDRILVVGKDWRLSEEASQIIEAAGGTVDHLNTVDPEVLAANCADVFGIMGILSPIPASAILRLERCRLIVRVGVGYDSVDVDAARDRGIPVCNVPDYCADEVADHALALALSLARGLPFLDCTAREGPWAPVRPYTIRAFETMTFGIVGLGRIGRQVARRAKAMKFRVAASDPYLEEGVFKSEGVARMDLDRLLASSDILSLHTPLTDETRHLLDAARLAKMKPGAILVNTARGAVVDNTALAAGLAQGHIAAAGLDVFEQEPLPPSHPLFTCKNVILTPHQAWHSADSERRLQIFAAEEVARALRGEPLRCRVPGSA